MKWLIYLLVILNVSFFVWQYRQTGWVRPTPPETLSASGQHQRLLLVEEVEPSVLRPREGSSSADEDQVLRSRASAKTPPVAVAAQAEQAASDKPAPGPEDAAASQPADVTPVDPSAGGEDVPEKPVVNSRRCYVLGPFPKDEAVEEIVGWLRSAGGAVDSRWTEQKIPKSYWVYLPPLPSTDEARAMLRRLAADGLQDYVRIMRGPMRNAISLGLYSQRESADRRLADLRNRGYQASVHIRYQSERVQWLDVSFSKTADPPGAAFQSKFPARDLVAAECR